MPFLVAEQSSSPSHIVILCPACGAVGRSLWEEEKGGLYLVSLSAGFYERLEPRAPYHLEIVCKGCGTAQNGRQPPQVSNDAGLWLGKNF